MNVQPDFIHRAWREFLSLVYPNGATADQLRQIHNAFHAGAFKAFDAIRDTLSDDNAERFKATMAALKVEKDAFFKEIAKQQADRQKAKAKWLAPKPRGTEPNGNDNDQQSFAA